MWFTIFTVAALVGQPAIEPTPIKADEQVVLFPSVGWIDADGAWRCEIRGWIFEPEPSSPTRGVALRAMAKALGLQEGDADTALFRTRATAFLVDCERGKRVAIGLGGDVGIRVVTPDTDAGGHFTATLSLDAPASPDTPIVTQRVRTILPENDSRTFETNLYLIPPHGLSVISDIDDTIKVSNVRDKAALLRGTFLEDYKAAPGMAAYYTRLRDAGAAFHYVSASPWQLHAPLAEFMSAAGYPAGTFEMRRVRAKDESLLKLFDDPVEYKRGVIQGLLRRWPDRTFVLIGDSGEKDPEIYLPLAKQHPHQITRVLIRDVTDEDGNAPRYQALAIDLPESLLVVFKDPTVLETPPIRAR